MKKRMFAFIAFTVTGPNSIISLGNNGIDFEVKPGTVTIERLKPDFKIIYDLVLENNKTSKESYSGSFALLQNFNNH